MSPRRLHTLLWRLVAGLLALSVAVIVTLLVERRMQALGQPVAALVAREAIPAYTAIRPDDVQVVRLPAAAVAEGALRDPAELEGRLARVEIPPGVPLYRQQVVPASDLRYTTDRRAVILALAVLPAHAPSNLLKPGQRVDVWTDGSIVTGDLRVVAVSSLSDGRLAVAVEAGQDGRGAAAHGKWQIRSCPDAVAARATAHPDRAADDRNTNERADRNVYVSITNARTHRGR